jgi:peptidyl-prolyl cis-trans isomerase A (cyclophilin A)
MNTPRVKLLFLACSLAILPPAVLGQEKAPVKKAATAKKAPAKAAAGATDPALLNPALAVAKAPESFKAHFTTSAGAITVEVTRAWSPLGADRFYNLVKHHFFDGAAFFRVVPGFVVQFGLSADPKVTQAWDKAIIKDDPVTQSNHRGSLTFATSGPNTRTTQLFINLGENGRLDSLGFSPFGTVIEGMDVVDKIYSGDAEKPDQGQITAKGKVYLDANFPKLDKILSTSIEAPPAAATPAKAPAKSTGTAPAKSSAKAPAKPPLS